MTEIIGFIASVSTIGAFILAGVIAFIGITQSKKKDTDRVYEYLEIMTKLKIELETAIASYAANQDNIEIFNNLNTRYTAFVNFLDYFSAKILNQKLYKNSAYKDFQGESLNGLKDWAIIQLKIFRIINKVKYRKFGIISADVTRKKDLKNTYKLLEITLPSKDYNELQDLCKKYGLF